ARQAPRLPGVLRALRSPRRSTDPRLFRRVVQAVRCAPDAPTAGGVQRVLQAVRYAARARGAGSVRRTSKASRSRTRAAETRVPVAAHALVAVRGVVVDRRRFVSRS